MLTTDTEAYNRYPELRHWYNKLWFSETMGYNCGPAGISPTISNWYIDRPMMNLFGMGVEARKIWIEKGETTHVKPGHFWCEWFEGDQYSVTYEWNGTSWKPISSWEGVNSEEELFRFQLWKRSNYTPSLINPAFDELSITKMINVEFIGCNPIEVHLRKSPDPDYDVLIPIWVNDDKKIDKLFNMDYNFIYDYDNADGFLEVARLGFMVKNISKGE
jgi:hypothetical protein